MSRHANPNGPRLPGVQLTATLSVAMVLLILGLAAVISLCVNTAADDIRGRVGFTVLVSDGATPEQLSELGRYWHNAAYVHTATYYTADQVLERYAATTGDTADITAELGVNPFLAEYDVTVTAPYAHPDSLQKITAPMLRYTAIADIVLNTDMVSDLRHTADSVTVILLMVAAVMLLVSVLLINNTVRLSIYSKRLLINTMMLVGATDGFIRRPFVRREASQGFVAALIAVVLLMLLLWYITYLDPNLTEVMPMPAVSSLAAIGVAVLVAGPVLCGIAGLVSANRYLRASYDDLFR